MEKLTSLFESKDNYKEIIAKGAVWVDPNFAHNDSIVQGLEGPFKWIRASELYKGREKVFSSFSPDDIEQGILGDCYLLSAISSLAEFPGRVEKIFIEGDRNMAGCYVVKFFLFGRLVDVVVDDFFPVDPYNRPAFAGTKSEELWVMLIEKAWAKLHGTYPVVEGGDSREAYVALTGAPTDYYTHKEQKQDKFWEIIKTSDSECYIMSTSASIEKKGIIKNHAYSLINAYEFTDKGENVRLVQIRNPWGSNEWNGEWCDNDPRWTPELLSKLHHVKQEDGMFFMPFKDFFTVFDHTFICKARDDYVHSNLAVEEKKAFAVFNISNKTKGYISVYQVSDRLGKVLAAGYAPALMKVELYKIDQNMVGMVTGGYSNALGQANLNIELEPGIYVVKASFEKATKLPWISFCSYADNKIDFVRIEVSDIYEINYQNASKLVESTTTLDTTNTRRKRKAGGFRRCLAGHRLEWATEASEGVEEYTCESCKAPGKVTDGWWICKECQYQICSKCRPKLPRQGGRRRRNKDAEKEGVAGESNTQPEEQKQELNPPQNEPQQEQKGESLEEGKEDATVTVVVKCGNDHEMKFVEAPTPNCLYLCDNCGKAYFGSVKRWFCEPCSNDICRTCLAAPEEFKDEQVPELESCPRGHKLEFVVMNTRNGAFGCCICGKSGYAQNGRWLCSKCNVSICTVCKPSESVKENVVLTDVTTMTCSKDHILVFSCRAPKGKQQLKCEKCQKSTGSDNWRWTCEACDFNICSKCRPAPEGRKDLICPNMHMLTQSNLPQNNSNYGRCDSCYKTIKYSDGRYCCLPCQYEFCNKCINALVSSAPRR